MRTLNEHIKNRTFKNVYLIYGPEDYLRRQYRDKLKDAVLPEGDTVNYNYYEGKGTNVDEVIELAQTMPFFAPHRLIIMENTGFFATSSDKMAAFVKSIPETTILVFVEENVDRRNKLFKAVTQTGYGANMESPSQDTLVQWIGGILKQNGRKITKNDVITFLSLVSLDMENIRQELEKLVCYTMGRDVVTEADIKAVCSVHTESRIFDMIGAVAGKNKRQALALYNDLQTLREPPLRILYLMSRQFNTLLQIRELSGQGFPNHIIAQRTGMKEFVVKKNSGLARRFSVEELRQAVEFCAQMEEDVKTGKLPDQIAVELVIYKYTA
ncbi:DNA polymerase-3 subunit delta [Catenibacillus scindens]|uniref:DNA polymerase III subunit delta n=1 Tax=Catenibacillus scindens TaxID=673271 RepID=A0A7W8HBA4_9FIRM|nr:DNA polymerase III subunit delta [Catenibacillus scindens]MBB5264537.1 DNA polymerase-3 subunit delta [Catenibacillus scindens]